MTKLFTCFNREHYAVYAPKLTACICEAFQIPQTSMLYIKMKSKSYEDLLRYLFFELRPEDIETAADLKELFCARLRSTLAGLLEKQCPECDGYRLIPDEHLKVQTHIPQLAPACVFVAGRLKCGQWSDKICILVVPYDWNNEHKILSDPFILDNFIHCMVVRLRKTQPKPICTVDVDGEMPGQRPSLKRFTLTGSAAAPGSLQRIFLKGFAAISQSNCRHCRRFFDHLLLLWLQIAAGIRSVCYIHLFIFIFIFSAAARNPFYSGPLCERRY